MHVYFSHKTGFEKSKGDQSALFVGETHSNPNSINHPSFVHPMPTWAQHSQVQNYKTPLFGHKIPKANKIQVNISHILKDVVGFKFIVFCKHNFGGKYLVLGHLYAGINIIFKLIIFSLRYNGDIKTLTYVNILKRILRLESCVQHCRHIETQSNHVLTGAYIR